MKAPLVFGLAVKLNLTFDTPSGIVNSPVEESAIEFVSVEIPVYPVNFVQEPAVLKDLFVIYNLLNFT